MMKSWSVSIIILVSVFFPPVSTEAAIGTLPFGGLVTSATVCTCPPFGIAIAYTPLFLGGPIPASGLLLFPPKAILYAWYRLAVTGTWNLGAFTPGGACNVLNPAAAASADPCAPPLIIPTEGTIKYMGTS